MDGDSDDWEQSKENIQPLRQGRTMSSLHAALAPQCQDDLKRKRREFEELLRTTSGVDLLDVYHRYVVWVEQHFPAGGHEVNLRQLLEQAISAFCTNRDFFNDQRYVDIWLRFVSLSPEPLAVLKAMFETEVGVQHAQFFVTWAAQLEAAGDSRRASRVLHAGIDRCAQPTSLLEEALRHLEARVGKQVAQGIREQQADPSGMEDGRTALAPLRARGKRGVAPVARTGPLARPADPQQSSGGLALVCAGQSAGNRGHTKVRVCDDSENLPPDAALLCAPAAPLVPRVITQGKENSGTARPWAGVTAKQRVAMATSSQPNFEIPEDEGAAQQPPCAPVLVPGSGKALSVRREPLLHEGGRLEGWKVPLALHEPPDPTKRSMYDKESVYRGATEFQFEELRVAIMRARQRQMAEERLRQQRERADLLQLELECEAEQARAARCERELALIRAGASSQRDDQVAQLQVAQLQGEVLKLRKELEEMRALLATTRSGTKDYSRVANRIEDLERTILATEKSMVVGDDAGMDDAAREEEEEQPEEAGSLIPAEGGATLSPPGSAQSGGSLRTVDVSRVVRGLWNCSLAQSSQLDSPSLAAPQAPAADEAVEATRSGTSEAAPAGAAPFEVFCEPTQTGSVAVQPPMDAPAMDVNDENRPPTNYDPAPEFLHPAKALQQRTPFAELEPEPQQEPAGEEDDALLGIEPLATDGGTFFYAASKSFLHKVTSTPFSTENTVPGVGEHFTLGGLTALVQGISLGGEDRLMPPPPAEQVVEQQQPACEPPPAAATVDAAAVVPLAKRRFSAAAADLSTILECSKEGKSASSSSGGSSCSSSSHHQTGGATLSTTQPRLPAVQEEHDGHLSRGPAPETPAAPLQGIELDSLDPFSEEVRTAILSMWQPCESDQEVLFESTKTRPVLKADTLVRLGGQDVKVLHHLATGAYARIYLAEVLNAEETYLDNDESFQPPVHDKVVLKLNTDSSHSWWEFYICRELHRRLAEAYPGTPARCVVDLQMGCFFSKSAVLVFPYCPYGTLLDVVGRYQKLQGKRGMPECLVLYFALELFITMDMVHACGIIHGDIKPDNILVIDFPSEAGFLQRFQEQSPCCVQLIDFGRSIDMWQMPPGTTFTQMVHTDGFACTEMHDGRPWTYQTDWFGLVGCLHVMLFGEYMEVERLSNGSWGIQGKFKRYWQQDLWSRIFSTLLNIPSCAEQPDVTPFVIEIQGLLRDKSRAHNVVLEALRAKNF